MKRLSPFSTVLLVLLGISAYFNYTFSGCSTGTVRPKSRPRHSRFTRMASAFTSSRPDGERSMSNCIGPASKAGRFREF